MHAVRIENERRSASGMRCRADRVLCLSFETADGGKTWKDAAPLPARERRVDWFGNCAWDPAGNVFCFATMGQPAWKYER